MHMLSIVFAVIALFATGGAIWFAIRAASHADQAEAGAKRCDKRATELQGERSRLISLESSYETLRAQHQKLQGRFYALRSEILDAASQPVLLPGEVIATSGPSLPDRPGHDLPAFCANYGQAQLEGPRSPAAACECGYCVEMRARRAAVKAGLLPRTNDERQDAQQAGLAGRRYERGE